MMARIWKISLLNVSCRYYARFRSLLRFAMVGVINTGVDFGVFTVLHSLLGINYLVCQVAGYTMGLLNSFIMNKLWTFENKRRGTESLTQFVKFVMVNLLSLSVSLIGLKLLSGEGGINVYFSKVLVTLVTQGINYLGYRIWVFGNRLQERGSLG